MIAAARLAAYEVARAVRGHDLDLATALAQRQNGLTDVRDRALLADITLGVARWRAALDYRIARVSARPLDRLDDAVVDILRLSAYQLLHLTRVPAAAVVADAVDLTRRGGKGSAAGFVNAVLRSLSRQRAAPLPGRPALPVDIGDPASRARCLDYLSITLSHPRWLVSRWLDRLGFETTERWLMHANEPGRVVLRRNPLRLPAGELVAALQSCDVSVVPGRWAPGALVVESGRPFTSPLATSGAFMAHDEASQLVALLAGDSPGPRILDTCAAPGGKTLAMATGSSAATVVACDARSKRMRLLAQTVRTAGASNVWLVQADATDALPFHQAFDTVLVDAPCSGLGVLRRDPDIRWRRRAEDLQQLARVQLQMLLHASAVVRPGGRLIYATCSTEPEENEDVADAFLRVSDDFSPYAARLAHPQLPPETVDARGHLRTTPHDHGLDGFFGAVFVRRSVRDPRQPVRPGRL